MERKKVLYFMPDNPMKGHAGNISRCKQLLAFFSEQDEQFDTDFVSERIWGNWDDKSEIDFKNKYPKLGLKIINRKFKRDDFFKYLFVYKLPNLFVKPFEQNRVDLTSVNMRKEFKKVLQETKYDIIIISYAQWGKLVDYLPYAARTIIDTHDFISLLKVDDLKSSSKASKNLKSEISILKKFQSIWTFSIEEKYIFGQFCQRKVDLIPIGYKLDDISSHPQDPLYDIIYVASENPHNIKGIKWFTENVLPKLPPMKIAVIGKIANYVTEHPSIHKLGFVDDLDAAYRNSKISICPMLSGTGIKIKVLESLSMGLPVVTNSYGVTGLVNKINSGCLVTDDSDKFANYILDLLNNPEYRNQVAKQGQELMRSFYNLELEKKVLLYSLLEPAQQ